MIGQSSQTLEDAQRVLRAEFTRQMGVVTGAELTDLSNRALKAYNASATDKDNPLGALQFMRGFMSREAEVLALKKMVADLEGRFVVHAREAQGKEL